MQGPKRPRRCTLPTPGGHPSCGNRCPLNPPNRRVRTRTHGGVGGEEPRGGPPYPDFGSNQDALCFTVIGCPCPDALAGLAQRFDHKLESGPPSTSSVKQPI